MSCLFDSLVRGLQLSTSSQMLRESICDHLASNPNISGLPASDVVLSSNNQSLASYISDMRRPSTWGGALEIKAACDLHHVTVYVLVLHTGRTIEFLPEGDSIKRINLSWSGSHFECMRSPINPTSRVLTVAQRNNHQPSRTRPATSALLNMLRQYLNS